jgi:GPH family glycoside/pentoside/hexuronide:cation symporter
MTWFGACFVMSFLFVTMVAIPRAALAVELTLDGTERRRLFGSIALFIALGLIAGALLPGILAGIGVSDPRDRMQAIAVIEVAGYLLTNLWFLHGVPERKEFLHRGRTPFVPGLRRALRSPPFRVMFASHVVTSIPLAIPATLMPYFVEYVILSKNATAWTGILLLAYLVSGFLFLPAWIALAAKIGKLKVWLIVSFIGVTGGAAWFFVGPGDERWALALQAYVGMQASVWYFLGGAMHADIVDYDELLTGKRREAQYSAYWTIIPKFALILGASVPLAVMQTVGYQPNQAQSDEVVLTLRILFALVPAALNAIGLSIMWWYPLSEETHAAIRRGIAAHARGETVVDPIAKRRLPPPTGREVAEETAWRLDHFSKGDLEALLVRGAPVLGVRVIVSMLVPAAVAVGAVAFALARVRGVATDPGVFVTLAVVVAGVSIAAFLFHLLRLAPALAMRVRPVPDEVVRAHLRAVG